MYCSETIYKIEHRIDTELAFENTYCFEDFKRFLHQSDKQSWLSPDKWDDCFNAYKFQPAWHLTALECAYEL